MITVIGGTGRLGRLVVAKLAAQDLAVRVVARNRPAGGDELSFGGVSVGGVEVGGVEVGGVEFVRADVRDPSTIAAAVAGSTVVISAINGLDPAAGQSPADVDRDGNLRLIAAAREAGAHLVLMSIIGAREDSPIEIARMKAGAERAARESDGLEWTIIRAAAFAELWRDVLRQTAGRSGRPTVFGRGENPINVVSVEDVAVAVVRAALDPALIGAVIDVGGPRNVTMNELATWATGSATPRHIPRGMLRVGAALSAPVRPAIARLMRQALAMDTADLTFDPSRMRAAYPWLPCHDVVGEAALSV